MKIVLYIHFFFSVFNVINGWSWWGASEAENSTSAIEIPTSKSSIISRILPNKTPKISSSTIQTNVQMESTMSPKSNEYPIINNMDALKNSTVFDSIMQAFESKMNEIQHRGRNIDSNESTIMEESATESTKSTTDLTGTTISAGIKESSYPSNQIDQGSTTLTTETTTTTTMTTTISTQSPTSEMHPTTSMKATTKAATENKKDFDMSMQEAETKYENKDVTTKPLDENSELFANFEEPSSKRPTSTKKPKLPKTKKPNGANTVACNLVIVLMNILIISLVF